MSSVTVPPSLHDNPAILRVYGAHPLHTDGDLLGLAFAPDGTLWSVEDAGVLRHWDLAAQQQIAWQHLEELATLWCFSPDARLVAAGSDELTVWDVQSAEALAVWRQPDWVTAVAFHPHRPLVATGHDDCVVRVWDLHKLRAVYEFNTHRAPVSALAFSPDGTKLASAGEDKTIHLWDVERGGPCGRLLGHTDRIPALAFHPDGRRLVSAGWDTTARVWDIKTCEPIILLNSHAMQVHTLAFNADGSRLACADSANAVHVWDMDRNRTVSVLPAQGNEIRCLAFSPDGQKLASGGVERVVHVWDARRGGDEDHLADPQLSRTALAVRADGKQLASLGAGTHLRVWDSGSGENVLSLEHTGVLRTFAASPNGTWIAASLADENRDGPTLGLWQAATGKRLMMLDGPKPPVTAMAFSPDSVLLASAGCHNTDVWLWQIPSGDPMLLLPDATEGCSVEAVAWHPQGRVLACGGIDWLSTGGSDGRVTLWDVFERKQIATFHGGATALTFHPSGKRLAAATLKNTVRVRDLDGDQPELELIGHFDAVTCLAYSPDGRLLATGSDDHTVRLWDAGSCVERGMIELDTQIKALAFSPDGRHLYTGNGNTSCYQIDVRQIPEA
jgi:WD40 repeat protein